VTGKPRMGSVLLLKGVVDGDLDDLAATTCEDDVTRRQQRQQEEDQYVLEFGRRTSHRGAGNRKISVVPVLEVAYCNGDLLKVSFSLSLDHHGCAEGSLSGIKISH